MARAARSSPKKKKKKKKKQKQKRAQYRKKGGRQAGGKAEAAAERYFVRHLRCSLLRKGVRVAAATVSVKLDLAAQVVNHVLQLLYVSEVEDSLACRRSALQCIIEKDGSVATLRQRAISLLRVACAGDLKLTGGCDEFCRASKEKRLAAVRLQKKRHPHARGKSMRAAFEMVVSHMGVADPAFYTVCMRYRLTRVPPMHGTPWAPCPVGIAHSLCDTCS